MKTVTEDNWQQNILITLSKGDNEKDNMQQSIITKSNVDFFINQMSETREIL